MDYSLWGHKQSDSTEHTGLRTVIQSLFATPRVAARQASLSFITSQSLLKLMSIESVMPPNHLISVVPFSRLQSFPPSGSFPVSQFSSGG